MSEKSENRINKNNSLYNDIMIITYDILKTNLYIIIIFVILGLLLAIFGFDLDKESYNSLFSTMATIALALVGFIGIFLVFLLENNRNMILYYFSDLNRLKDKLKIYPVFIKEPDPEKIKNELKLIKEHIKSLDYEIEGHIKEKKVIDREVFNKKVEEKQTLNHIEYILEYLILEHINLERDFEPYKKSFLFAISSIFLFMIPIALNHINFLSDNYIMKYIMKFEYWSLVKMFFTGFLFGLFFIILKDSAIILNEIFDRLDILKHYPKGVE